MRRLLLAIAVVGISIPSAFAAEPPTESRVWKDASGAFSVEATLEGFDGDTLVLKRADSQKTVKVPLSKLSEADQAYVRSLRAKDDPFLPQDTSPKLPPSLVHLRLESPRSVSNLVGAVIYTDDKIAVISFPRPATVQTTDTVKADVILRVDGEVTRVPAKVLTPIGHYRHGYDCLVSIPSQPKLKAVSGDLPELKLPLDAQAIGLEAPANASETLEFTSYRVSVNSVTPENMLSIVGHTQLPAHSWIVLDNGTVVAGHGNVKRLPHEHPSIPTTRGTAEPIKEFLKTLEPHHVISEIEPMSGDREHIVWRFATIWCDPLGKSTKLVARVKPVPRGQSVSIPSSEKPKDNRWAPIPDTPEIDLAPANPPITIKLVNPRGVAAATLCMTCEFKAKNVGIIDQVQEFSAQIGWIDSQGERRYSSPLRLHLMPDRDDPRVAAIPGLNGRPLDFPEPVKVNGGWRLTDEVTRLPEQDDASPPDLSLPEPTDKSLFAFQDNRLESHAGDRERGGRYACYSADGRWLFLLVDSTTLLQFDTGTMRQVRLVRLTANALDICVSKAGLVVTADWKDSVWVLDPDTLKQRRQISVPGVIFCATTPSTDIGLAVARPPREAERVNGALYVVDFSTGKKFHRLLAYGYSQKLDGKMWPLGDVEAMTMSPDGKNFYAIWSDVTHRFRLDSTDVVFEECSPKCDGDGHQIGINASGTLLGAHGVVFKAHNLSKPFLAGLGHTTPEQEREGAQPESPRVSRLSPGMQQLLAQNRRDENAKERATNKGVFTCFDPKNNRIYLIDHGGVIILDEQGERRGEIKGTHTYPLGFAIDPEGNRLVVWNREGFVYYPSLVEDGP